MAKDPYKYFRVEARDLVEGLSQGILKLERGAVDKTHVGHLLRLAHTLKGAARVVKQPSIAELSHSMEEMLAVYREGAPSVPKETVTSLLGVLDHIKAKLAELAPPEAAKEAPGTFEAVRVDIAELDAALEGISEAAIGLVGLRRAGTALEDVRRYASGEMQERLDRIEREWKDRIEHVERELRVTQERVGRIRLVEAHMIFATLDRAARDAAQTVGKRVEFETQGGEIRLEAHVLAALSDALLHVVRNAVAHGIESESERIAAGKQPAGRVVLRVERRGSRVAFICRDDGRGLDLEAIRRVAARHGPAPETLDDAVKLILKGGVTTAGAPTEVSGRGVGLDVVRDTVARLKGEVKIKSEPGRGAAVEIAVPMSLSSQAVLRVEAGGMTATIPLDSVVATTRVKDEEIARSTDRVSITVDGAVLPLVTLGPWQRGSVVIVRSEESRVAVGVDRILGAGQATVRPLPVYLQVEAHIGGASIGTDGTPHVHLDPKGLAEMRGTALAAPPPVKRAPLLVIDDSLTTRMLEQSILESAGFEVDLATSAEEGMSMARKRRYGVFVVDVEMPGMNGFEFVERTRADSDLRQTPAILVTSRNAPQDRRRGEQAGAQAYIYKGEFDQAYLLQTIRKLLGEE